MREPRAFVVGFLNGWPGLEFDKYKVLIYYTAADVIPMVSGAYRVFVHYFTRSEFRRQTGEVWTTHCVVDAHAANINLLKALYPVEDVARMSSDRNLWYATPFYDG